MIAIALAGLLAGAPQDPKKIDEAVLKGLAFLNDRWADPPEARRGTPQTFRSQELVLWTFLACRVPEGQKLVQKLFADVIVDRVERTYQAALQAVILEELDRVKYQWKIKLCGQFLLDTQLANGQWSYGEAPASVLGVAPGKTDLVEGAKFDPSGRRVRPRVTQQVTLRKTAEGTGVGDNSNSAYAAMGIRACHESGIVFPNATIRLAEKAWADTARGYSGLPGMGTLTGWDYARGQGDNVGYGSMTAGAVASLSLYASIWDPKGGWTRDKRVARGIEWLAKAYAPGKNPKLPDIVSFTGTSAANYFYYLAEVERAGSLTGTDRFGTHDWYAEGAEHLLAAQKPDGSWELEARTTAADRVWNTCFALLFLKRATRPLAAR
jgi:hypothetical protein